VVKARQIQQEPQKKGEKMTGDSGAEQAECQYERGHNGRYDKLPEAAQLTSDQPT